LIVWQYKKLIPEGRSMLENCQSAKERWGGVSGIIDKWLKDRQDLIVKFCSLSATSDLKKSDNLAKEFERLCELLVDYVSAGHFEVYDQLVAEAKEFDDGGIEVAEEIIPKIQKTTEQALRFNDRFDVTEKSERGLSVLLGDLSELGEILEERFELEDVLIETLHTNHADQVA
jgi:regulator of sigma D